MRIEKSFSVKRRRRPKAQESRTEGMHLVLGQCRGVEGYEKDSTRTTAAGRIEAALSFRFSLTQSSTVTVWWLTTNPAACNFA